jgi:hypothetical protein
MNNLCICWFSRIYNDGMFNHTAIVTYYIASNGGGVLNAGLKTMWKEAVLFLIIMIETRYTVGANEE